MFSDRIESNSSKKIKKTNNRRQNKKEKLKKLKKKVAVKKTTRSVNVTVRERETERGKVFLRNFLVRYIALDLPPHLFSPPSLT